MSKIKKQCNFCSEIFEVWESQSHQMYCSKTCYSKSRHPFANDKGEMVKRCSTCSEIKLVDQFYRCQSYKSGYQTCCKMCEQQNHASWYQEASQKEDFKSKLLKDNRTPKRRFCKGRHSATRRNYVWKLTFEQYENLVAQPCHYCSKQIDDAGVGLDRKNNGNTYSLLECVPCCGRCNSTFMDNYEYHEKLQLAEVIRRIDSERLLLEGAA